MTTSLKYRVVLPNGNTLSVGPKCDVEFSRRVAERHAKDVDGKIECINAPARKLHPTVAVAHAIAEEIRSAKTWLAPHSDEENKAVALVRVACAERIARSYAQTIDGPVYDFFSECGMFNVKD